MNTFRKYTLLLIAFALSAHTGMAQDTSATGEIVMTRAQLESFLGKIAKLKKEQLAKQREMNTFQDELPMHYQPGSVQARNFSYQEEPEIQAHSLQATGRTKAYATPADERILDQLELLNAKLNALTSEIEVMKLRSMMNNTTGYNTLGEFPSPSGRQQPQMGMNPKLQPVIINQGTPSQPYVNYVPQTGLVTNERRARQTPVNSLDSASINAERIGEDLTSRISGLENELQLLQQLKSGSDTTERTQYDNQISEISSQIAALQAHLSRAAAAADSAMERKEQNLTAVLRDFSRKVYFANNSTSIASSDVSRLQDVVRIAQHNPDIMVVLRGFASKAGNPAYNEKISYQRANAVKDLLLKNGLPRDQILTMHYGEDDSVDPARARRVEISFRVP